MMIKRHIELDSIYAMTCPKLHSAVGTLYGDVGAGEVDVGGAGQAGQVSERPDHGGQVRSREVR